MHTNPATLAPIAAETLRTLADSLDAAGPSPGAATQALLAADRDAAVWALRALANALPPGQDRNRARGQAALVAHPEACPQRVIEADADAMRRWARAWDAWAARRAA